MRPSNLHVNPISFLKSLRRTMRFLAAMLSVLILNLFTSCSYYQVKGVPDDAQKSELSWLQSFNQAEKFIVIHQDGVSLHLQNSQIDESNYELKGIPVNLPPEHTYKHSAEIGKGHRYKRQIQSPFNEVHLFLDNQIAISPGQPLSIPISSIEKIGYSAKDTA